jgi:hypothetical protein
MFIWITPAHMDRVITSKEMEALQQLSHVHLTEAKQLGM